MTFIFYGMEMSPPCTSVTIAMRLAKVQYEYKVIDLMKKAHLHPDFLKINPNHTVPTINDNGFVIWESRAIMQYIFNRYAPESSLYPSDPMQRAKVDSLMNYDQGTFYTTVSAYIYNSLGIRPGKRDDPVEKKSFWDQVQFIEDHLLKDNQKFLTGNTMTIADISLGISMSMPMVFLGDKCYKKFPKITTWRGELMKVPEYAEG